MRKAEVHYFAFVSVSFIVAISCTIGLDAYARAAVGRYAFDQAWSEAMFVARENLVPALASMAPYFVLGIMAARWSNRRSVGLGATLFVLGGVAMALAYLNGYMNAAATLADRKWTASGLALGFALFEAMGILFLVQLGAEIWDKRGQWRH